MDIEESSFSLEVSKGLLARLTNAAIGFLGSIVFARVLGPEGYGAFFVVIAFVNLLNRPIIGWAEGCKKRFAEASFPSDEALGAGLLAAAVLSVVLIPSGLLLNDVTGLYDLSSLVVPFVAFFVAISFYDTSATILSGRANFSTSQWTDTLRSILTTPSQLGLVLLAGMGTVGMVYGVTLATILVVPYTISKIGVRARFPSRQTIESVATYAKFSIPNRLLGETKSRLDVLLLAAVLSSSAVGKYQVALQLTIPAQLLGNLIAVGLMGRASYYWSTDNAEQTARDLSNSMAYASFLAIPIFFGSLAMPSDILVTVFGSQYTGVGLVLIGLALFRIINSQSVQLGSVVDGYNRPDIGTRVGVITLVVNVVLGLLLYTEFGILGVVFATVVAEAIGYTILVYYVKRDVSDFEILPGPLLHQFVAGLSMFAVVELVHSNLQTISVVTIGGVVSMGALIYIGTLFLISNPFRETVLGIAESVYT